MSQPAISIENLTRRFGQFEAVSRMNLQVFQGEVFTILGPNGAGKTTTIRMLMGLLEPSSGSAAINGLNCHSRRPEVMECVGYRPEEPILYDYLRGIEIIRLMDEMHGLSESQFQERSASLLDSPQMTEDTKECAIRLCHGVLSGCRYRCQLCQDRVACRPDNHPCRLQPDSAGP